MLYYLLPSTDVYGGVKKGFNAADLLTRSGHPCQVATPGGERPTWFPNEAETFDRDELPARCQRADTVFFSWPPDVEVVRKLPARRKIVHMQGANSEGDRKLFAEKGLEFISHGLHMTQQLLLHGRIGPYVPLGIRDVFRWNGEEKEPRSVAVMSRKGGRLAERVRKTLPRDARLRVLEGLTEDEVAVELKQCDLFVPISSGEAFGLPPLEAMAAGCCVVGYPGDGGFEFMRHGETAHVVPNDDRRGLKRAVKDVLERSTYRDGLRERARSLAAYYTLERERTYLLRALGLDDE